jgi:hypothetical protein
MFKQILITLLVLAVVVAFTRLRRSRRAAAPAGGARRSRRPSAPAMIGYGFVLVMIVAAAVMSYLQWQDAHQVMTIQVVNARSGAATTYHVYRKDLGGRAFRTVDGRYISLGGGDRMEVTTAE